MAWPNFGEQIEELERAMVYPISTAPVEQMVRLGMLYWLEAHEPERAFMWFDFVATTEEGQKDGLGAIWLGVLCYLELFWSGFIERAQEVVSSLYAVPNHKLHGAAAYVLLKVRQEMSEIQEIEHQTSSWPWPESEEDLLLESVAYEPDWVNNRRQLASLYEEKGQRLAALEQYQLALSAMDAFLSKGGDKIDYDEDILAWGYEYYITGRLTRREDLLKTIALLEQGG